MTSVIVVKRPSNLWLTP